MTILQSLDGYYARMAARGDAEPTGFSREKISYRVVLSPDGAVANVISLLVQSGRKRVPQLLNVPAAVKRTAGIRPNLLWDKTAYCLGRTAGDGRRTAEEHASFIAANVAFIGDSTDEGLLAYRRFLQRWQPADFDAAPFTPAMLDTNLVFALSGALQDIHDRPAALVLLAGVAGNSAMPQTCLVTGLPAAPARLHPIIRGVWGAQSSGAALVSFNLEAFTSYGKEQGDNAPTSEAAAFRYGAALNRMLDTGSRNRVQRPVGDTNIVFWADTSPQVSEQQAAYAEDLAAYMFAPPSDETEAVKLRASLDNLAKGRPAQDAASGLAAGTRFHVLGLSPNAARLSVRYWYDGSFDVLAMRLAGHFHALHIEPSPWHTEPSVNIMLVRTTALQQKFDNIPKFLAGEVMRAILTGGPYPRAWLAAAIMRLRAGDDPATGWHAAAIKACLHRTPSEEMPPVSLDPDDPHPAYQLGRLFAVLEAAQREDLGKKVNATIADRYYGAASATPALVFGPLLRGARNHISSANKRNKGRWLNGRIEAVMAHLPSELPRTLRLEDQGRFAIGYYHERAYRPAHEPADVTPSQDATDE